jgi:hypothetical protein
MTGQAVADIAGHLGDALAALVPLAIAELEGSTFEQRRTYLAGAADIIASRADQMMFHDPRKARAGSSPGVLPALVRGVAVLAYQPGGVTVFGLHFCVHHEECVAADAFAAEHADVPLPTPPAGRLIETVELPPFVDEGVEAGSRG